MKTETQKPPPDPELMNRIFTDIVLLKSFIDGLFYIISEFDNDIRHLIGSAPSDKPHRFENYLKQ